MFGDRLKSIREYLQLNQKDFAIKLNISQQVLSNYEKGQRDVPNNILLMLPQFDVNPIWLLTGEGEMLLTAAEPQQQAEQVISHETMQKITGLLEEEFQKRLNELQPLKTTKVPNHAAPKNRPPESLAKDKPLDIIDNNVTQKGKKLIDLHKVTAKKMSGYVAAGYGADGGEYVECIISADQVLGRTGEDLFSFTVVGESMLYAGVYPGDLLMISPTEEPKIGDIVLAKTTDGLTVKNYQKDTEGRFVLHPDNYHFPDIVIDKTVQIIGVVMSAVRIFKK